MLRIVDMRDATSQDQGFAVWDTVRDEFLSQNGCLTWDGESDFRESIDWDESLVNRICGLLPDWAKLSFNNEEQTDMAAEYYTTDEKRIVHQDGWHIFVRDGDEELVQIGYREWRDGKCVEVGEPLSVTIEFTRPLAEALQYFADRPTVRIKSEVTGP